MRAVFGSTRDFLDTSDYLVQIFSGQGNLTQAGTRYFWFQLANRGGLSLAQVNDLQINYNPGDRIEVTWQPTAIRSGEDVFYLVVSVSETNNREDAVLLSAIAVREADQQTFKPLPIVLNITEDAHLGLNKIYADQASLPSGNDLIDGVIATIDGNTNYLYDASLLEGDIQAVGASGYWIETHLPILTYQDNTKNQGGTDYRLFNFNIGDYLTTPPRVANNDSIPIRFWLLNDQPEDEGSQINPGTSFDLEVLIGDRAGEENKLADAISYRIVGLARKLTGVLYTDVAGANFSANWNRGLGQLITNEAAILPGYALVVDIWFNTQSDRLLARGDIKASEILRINDIYSVGEVGTRSDLWEVAGDSKTQGLLIVPNLVTAGFGIAKGFSKRNYTSKALAGYTNELADQVVAFDAANGGRITVYPSAADLSATEAILGTISTLGGVYAPSDPSNSVTLTATGSLSLVLGLPVIANQRALIRSNYPEEALRNQPAHWHNPKLQLFLIVDSIIYARNDLIDTVSSASQTINIDSLDDFSQILQVPTQSDQSFGMFGYGQLLLSSGGTGTLPAGEYTAIAAYQDPSPNPYINKIDQSEAVGAMQQIDLSPPPTNFLRSSNVTVTEARALDPQDLQDGYIYGIIVNNISTPFIYKDTAIATDNGESVIKPTALGNTPGAFIPWATNNRFINSSGIMAPRAYIQEGQGVTFEDSAAANAITVNFDAAAASTQVIEDSLVWGDGDFLKLPDGTII